MPSAAGAASKTVTMSGRASIPPAQPPAVAKPPRKRKPAAAQHGGRGDGSITAAADGVPAAKRSRNDDKGSARGRGRGAASQRVHTFPAAGVEDDFDYTPQELPASLLQQAGFGASLQLSATAHPPGRAASERQHTVKAGKVLAPPGHLQSPAPLLQQAGVVAALLRTATAHPPVPQLPAPSPGTTTELSAVFRGALSAGMNVKDKATIAATGGLYSCLG